MLGTQEFRLANTREEQEAIAQEAWQKSAADAVKTVNDLSEDDLLPA